MRIHEIVYKICKSRVYLSIDVTSSVLILEALGAIKHQDLYILKAITTLIILKIIKNSTEVALRM